MSELKLLETVHPQKEAQARFEALVGIDSHKQQLVSELSLRLDVSRVKKWQKHHHPKGLPIMSALTSGPPLVLLSGEVGCGKTALATSVGTPLAHELDRKIVALETPSNIRGRGLVGELSARITEAFDQACARAAHGSDGSLLIIDEADDLATAREQSQAHHEDRAGVNVLIKQIDRLARESIPLVVMLITNRAQALDAAVTRRACLHLRFERPDRRQRRAVMERLLLGTSANAGDLDMLAEASRAKGNVPFSFSDLTLRLARSALQTAIHQDRPFDAALLLDELARIEPSPLVVARPTDDEVQDG